jgi:putative serine protease PepD
MFDPAGGDQMSIRDGVEPSRSPDSDTHTQPTPHDESAAANPTVASPGRLQPDDTNPTSASQGPRLQPDSPSPAATPGDQPTTPANQTWPPSWGQSASSSWGQESASREQGPSSWEQAPAPADSPTWTEPKAAQGPSWTEPRAAKGPSWTQPNAAQGPSWPEPPGTVAGGATATMSTGPEADSPRTGSPTPDTGPPTGQGGGGYPTVPAWGARPSDAGSPRGRRPSRWLAAAVAAAVLFTGGYWVNEALNDNPAPAGAGIPTAAPIAASPAPSGEEPAAAVAKALLPTVVEIRRGASGVGSGFVYDSNGYIMTAAHVIEGVDEVSVRLYDGTRLRGEVVGTDEANDVGVIKVDRTGLTAAPLAVGQTIQVGQLAVAIGSPFGLNETVTAGIVSATDRILDDGREVIQTDAPINPGNSGGVLADRRGRVIGINSAIRPGDNSNGNVGIGFAVPIDIAARSARAIVEGRQVEIGYLGVQMAPPTGNQDGVLVQVVTAGSPAEQAGLRVGDLVVAIDGQAVATTGELGARIRSHQPGDKITLKIVRDGNETTIAATLTQRPAG